MVQDGVCAEKRRDIVTGVVVLLSTSVVSLDNAQSVWWVAVSE